MTVRPRLFKTAGPLHNGGLGGTTWAWCQNMTGEKCNNGQTAYWYSQGCFIGCDACDHVSGRRQTDLCKKGFVGLSAPPWGG